MSDTSCGASAPISQDPEAAESCAAQLSTDEVAAGRDTLARHYLLKFDEWVTVGRGWAHGHAYAVRNAGKPKGLKYNRHAGDWIRRYGYDKLDKAVRSRLLDVVEHLDEITAWRDSLEAKDRDRANHPWRNAAEGPRSPRKPKTFTEIIKDKGLEATLEAMPREWLPKLEERVARQDEALAAQRTSDKELSREFRELLELTDAAELLEKAVKIRKALGIKGRELKDLAVYLHRTPARQTPRTDRRQAFTIVNGTKVAGNA
jgi:hypothetical protein